MLKFIKAFFKAIIEFFTGPKIVLEAQHAPYKIEAPVTDEVRSVVMDTPAVAVVTQPAVVAVAKKKTATKPVVKVAAKTAKPKAKVAQPVPAKKPAAKKPAKPTQK